MYSDRPADVNVMPAMPVHALSPIHSTTPLPTSNSTLSEKPSELSRSASFTYLSGSSRDGSSQSIKRTFSENVLSFHSGRGAKVSDSMQSANKELFRRASRKTKKKMSGARFSLSPDDEELDRDTTGPPAEGGDTSKTLSRSVTGTIRSLARKSWMSSGSSSTSPVWKDEPTLENKRSWSPTKKAAALAVSSIAVPEPAVSRSSSRSSHREPEEETGAVENEITVLPRQGRQANQNPRHIGSLAVRNKSESSLRRLSRKSSLSSMRSQSPAGRSQLSMSANKIPPLPTSMSSDRLSALNGEVQKKKDPLWSAFRHIDGEYVSFQSKTAMQKAKVLRMSFLPFLTKHVQHPSNKSLRAEDLDRRVMILNKWWTGILEVLNGRNNQSISGTDRPAFLEAAAGIMMRPEWRIPKFTSNSTETPRPLSVTKSKSTNSLKSEESDFLLDSIHQNVRNIFAQNLLSQIAFVVEKLSMRSAPASLVTFSGKACAYAFFFCPGVADMLVRLWRLPSGTLGRIFAEMGVERGDRLDLISKGLMSSFPNPVRSLMTKSHAALSRHLQHRGHLPPGTESIHWHGPWTGRWCGRDSDLFFVFTKYYHILVSEFLPEGVFGKDRSCVPGFVLLHAKILNVLENTIYRQAGQHTADNYASGTAGNLDASDAAALLPMTIANASRSIAENRLVMLLRDILADSSPEHSTLRTLFASSFDDTIKAATRKISLYNNDACFILCDFMEEVLPIMSRYHHIHSDTPTLDWSFWLQVCRQMMQSQTTLTQIRLISFVYTTWSILISNEQRKREMVLDWLLEQEFFNQHFCHWSPMVRHYFYRLLCWRVARCDASPTDLDIEILETLSSRLNKCWAHYQYLNAEADMRELCPPSSAPCSPAPSRCLIIIRTDSQPVPSSTFPSFDKFLPIGLINQNTPYRAHSSVLNTVPPADTPSQPGNKKRWSLFRNIMPFNSLPGNTRPGEVTPPASPDESTTSLDASSGPTGAGEEHKALSRPATPPHQALSFKFSLEFVDSRPNLANKNRKLTTPLLPTNAQRVLDDRRQMHSQRQSDDRDSSNNSVTGSVSNTSSKSSIRYGEVRPLKPIGTELETARYAGRALAEWAHVLTECHNFYTRRKAEGCPSDKRVEIPVLGVETFRMLG